MLKVALDNITPNPKKLYHGCFFDLVFLYSLNLFIRINQLKNMLSEFPYLKYLKLAKLFKGWFINYFIYKIAVRVSFLVLKWLHFITKLTAIMIQFSVTYQSSVTHDWSCSDYSPLFSIAVWSAMGCRQCNLPCNKISEVNKRSSFIEIHFL